MVKKFCCKFISMVMIMVMVMLACISLVYADSVIYQAKFQPGMWDREDWIEVKSPRWDFIGGWVQKEEWIENLMPEDHKPGTMFLGYGFAYVSMVYKEKVCLRERVIVSSTMAFEYDQAPQIVIAPDLGKSEEGFPEHREHFEVVMWSRGINIWHHIIEDGKPQWALVAYSRFPLEAGKPYEMVVTIDRVGRLSCGFPRKEGRWITVEVDGHKFGYYESSLPDAAYVGIIGYASRNRFYDFRIKRQ